MRNEELECMKTAKFKMTEIGPIPKDWDVKRLGELFAFKNGYNTDARNYGRGMPVASVLEALSDRPLTVDRIRGKVDACRKDQDLFSLKRDDLIFTRSSEILEDVGRSNVYEDDSRAMFGGFVIRGRPKTKNDSRFINYLLKDSSHRDRIIAKGAGAQHYNIGQNGLAKVFISLPPLPEQKKIAEALSDVDELLAAMRTLIEKKRAIKQGAMQELLTGKKRLVGFKNSESSCLCASVLKKDAGVEGGDFNTETQRRRGAEFKMTEIGLIPEDWEVKKLGDVCKIIMGQSPASVYYNIKGNGLPLIQGNADLEKRKSIIRFYTSQITKICDVGDVVLSVRAPVGAVGKAEYKSCLGRGVCALKYENDYLYQYLLFVEDKWGEFSKGSTFDSINSNELAEYKLPLPPTLAEQRAIAKVLSDMDAEIEALEAKRAKYESIKQGMMQELLTGKTRLV